MRNNEIYNEIKKGKLFIIGGGYRSKDLMNKYVDLAGGTNSNFLIVSAASQTPVETALGYIEEFTALNCKNVNYLDCEQRNIDSENNINLVKNADAVFFSGGDQNKLTETLNGTKVLDLIKNLYISGGLIGGTSAGAAIMSKLMITSLIEYKVDPVLPNSYPPPQGSFAFSTGFGFLEGIVVDQHFSQRNRHSRLINAVKLAEGAIGMGIDESTAAIVNSNGNISVAGEGNVYFYSERNFGGELIDFHGVEIYKKSFSRGEVFEVVTHEYLKNDTIGISEDQIAEEL